MSKCVSRLYNVFAVLIAFSLLPIFPHPSAVAATQLPTLTESTDGQALASHLRAPHAAVSLPIQDLFEYGTKGEALFPILALESIQVIQITDAGFNPATLAVFGPSDVTWINATTITQTLQSGTPITTTTGNNIYLPVVQRGGATSFAAAASYLDLLMQQAASEPTFSATVPPGQSFRYRYLKPGVYQYHLASAPQFKGEVNLSGVALLRANPSNGEDDVAVTRETILEFSDALDAATVTAAAFAVTAGNTTLDYRLNLSADKSRVTLFYKDALPGSVRVRVMVDGSKLKDGQGLAVDVDGDGVAGGTQVIEFDTLSLTVLPGTSVCGRVFASELAVNASNVSVNTPLKGATVTVDGMEDALRTTSDDNGNFCLDPAPAGRFFVHIDGRSVTTDVPAGTYYPFVGKAWQSVAGQQTNVGDVFLPLIPAGTLQNVSVDQNTQITFPDAVVQQHPELIGISIVVPADSLYSDDGSRGGKVGIAPVPPDRLPGTLPEGLEFPVVITVQTDGAGNFDQPAPVCFPNLPDPNTGEKLDPGAKDALYSFSHDTGNWEVVGSMTVSADGKVVCSDPGVGIRAPGWHGSGPSPQGPPPPPQSCNSADDKNSSASFLPSADKCRQRCSEDFYRCLAYTTLGLVIVLTGCAVTTGPGLVVCAAVADAGAALSDAKCAHDAIVCKDRCTEDNCSANTQSDQSIQPIFPVLPGLVVTDDPIMDQLEAIVKQIRELVYPYSITEQPLPQDKLEQVTALLAQANTIAGGDAESYMRQYFLKAEQAIAPLEAEIGYSPGNVPAYPVLYMAEILRPDSTLRLRGKTGVDGQYSIFVPRDGQLLNISFYDPITNAWGIIYPRQNPKAPYPLPHFTLQPVDATFHDFDQDNLPDVVEFVYGTDPAKADTDNDGAGDGAEVQQGSDPLGGLIAQTGVIATGDTPGTAVDLCVQNNLAVVADSAAGVAFFNVFDVSNPLLVAQVDTPGNATRVACVNNRIAVADGNSGLAILDISNLATARIVHQLNLNTNVTAVATVGQLVYVGSEDKRVVMVDLLTGANLGQVTVGEAVQDLVINGEHLYVLTAAKLYTFAIVNTTLILQSSVASPGITGAGGRLWRLFVGGSLAYATHNKGYNTFDLSQPEQPTLIAAGNTAQFGWKQLVSNGSGVGVAAVGANSTNDGAHDISLYDLSNPTKTDEFITTFLSPGLAAAVTLYNGRAYVADSAAGMQVINYLPFDNKGIPPTITLESNFSPGVAEENSLMRLTAVTSDDVQVRNVEFYIDGTLTATDGNYPFETRFTTPLRNSQPFFNVRVKATDTGGNFAWTDTIRHTLVTDATPPRLLTTAPQPAEWILPNTVSTVSATFNEPILPASVTATTFRLFDSGLDKLLGTEDDQQVPGTVSYDEATKTARLTPPAALDINSYRAVVNVTDIAGNPLKGGEFKWNFFVGVTNWDGGGDNLSWHDAQNWSNDLVPVNGALVVIDSADTNEIIFSQGEVALTSVQSNRPLQLNGGKLTINADSVIDANFNLTSGELSGSGTVTVTGTLAWASGRMTGSGKTISTNNLVLGGANFTARHLQQRRLENAGTAILYSSYFYIYDSGLFVNRAGAAFTDLSSVGGVQPFTAPANGQLLNAGTFTKSGDGSLVISQVAFTNTGTINLQVGSLNLRGTSTNSGIINLATSTILDVDRIFVNQAGGRISGSGTLDYSSATSFTNDGTIDPTVIVVP